MPDHYAVTATDLAFRTLRPEAPARAQGREYEFTAIGSGLCGISQEFSNSGPNRT